MERIRVLIADDHPLFRDGVRTLLTSVPETDVVGEAATGEEAITQAALLQPDVILPWTCTCRGRMGLRRRGPFSTPARILASWS